MLLCVLQVFINSWPLNGTVAFISLPSVLRSSPTSTSTSKRSRVIFQFFGLPMLLFQVKFLHNTGMCNT